MFDIYNAATGLLIMLSVSVNIFLIWYCRSLLRRMFFISEHMVTLVEEIVYFHEHLSKLNEMEVFYGDETIGDLIRHSNGLIETLEDFEEIYTMFDAGAEELFEEISDDKAESNTAPQAT